MNIIRGILGMIMFSVVFIGAEMSSDTLKEIFRDEFNQNGILDPKKWNVANRVSAVNNELQFYTLDALTVKDGYLDIRSERRSFNGSEYTSGRVDTRGHFDFLYGEIEWRAKIPQGRGIWPALWLSHPKCAAAVPCSDYWPPAVSVLEVRGDFPRQLTTIVFYHSATAGTQSVGNTHQTTESMSLDFHLYRLSWQRDSLVWYIDNQEILRVSDPEKIPQVPLQIVMNVAVGGGFPGPPDDTTVFPTDFLIDFVVVLQEDNSTVGVRSKKHGPAVVVPILVTFGGLLFIALFIVTFIQVKKRRLRIGNMRRESETGSANSEATLTSMLYARTSNASFDVLLKKYVSLVEIPVENLELSDKVLGKGEFGIVYKGIARGLRGTPKPTLVAVKMIISSVLDPDEERQLAEEIRVMTKIGRHLNVVNLLGIAVKHGKPLLLLEFCPYGSLLSYLKMHRGAYFYSQVDKEGNLSDFDEKVALALQADANQIISNRRVSFPEIDFDGLVMSTKDLLSFSYQISRGMEYLATRSIIHRDLAARNILVADAKVVKISDFGMARQRQSVYVLENDHMSLPVKWMPPEAIVSKTFSQKSDVWSYGILLWEIFSLGDIPYVGSGVSGYVTEFVAWLAEGHQMERPPAAPMEIDALLRRCWRLRETNRPTFKELRQKLDQLICVELADSYLALEEPYQSFNKLNQDLLNKMVFMDDGLDNVKE